MSFKQYLCKKIIPAYFMIVTFINIGMLIAGQIFFKEARFGYEVFFSPLLFGFLGCSPIFLDFLFKGKKANQGTIVVQEILDLIILEVCILGVAKLIGLIDSVLTAIIMCCMVFAIFAVVTALMYLQDRSLCKEMNLALSKYKERSQSDNE